MKLSSKISFLRKRDGMSQETLAERIDVSRQTVYKWESGAATPEIAKLKQLAKLFNVSFDYLMDDEIEKPEAAERPSQKQPRYRYTFHSNIPMKFFEADLDHGYIDKRKRRIWNSDRIFQERREQMNEMLARIGADRTILLQGDMAGCFFDNPHEMFFGFYYGGNVQFLCPYENFINVQLCDSGPELTYQRKMITGVGLGADGVESIGIGSVSVPHLQKASSYRLLISYFDEEGRLCEFKLGVGCKRRYTLYEYNDPKKTELLDSIQSEFAREKLTEIITRLNAYPAIGQKIAEGKLTVKPLQEAALQELFEKGAREELAYEEQLEREAVESNKAHRRFWLFLLGAAAAVGVLILLGKGLSLLVDSIQANQRDKEAAAVVVHLIDTIGEVTPEDRETLDRIREAYNNLTDDQRKHVDNYAVYTEAHARFNVIYTEYMNELTKDDPTRGITADQLNGTWRCGDLYVVVGSYKSFSLIITGTNIQELASGATKRGVIPASRFTEAYDCFTQTKKGTFTHVILHGADTYVNRHDFSVFIDENGTLTMQLKNYTLTKSAG